MNEPANPIRHRLLHALLGVDVRSLALLRIGLAATLLWDVLLRLGDLHAHYGDDGVLPLRLLPRPGPGESDLTLPLSLHVVSGEPAWQAALLGLAGLAALALLVGWKTRLATAVSWFLALSVFTRNPLIVQGGDTLLRALLFWSMFLPLGARASLDARGCEPSPPRVFSAGTAALTLQMCILVFFAGLLKFDPAWRSDGDAVYRALVIGHHRTWFGDLLFRSRGLMELVTFWTLIQECALPFLLFVPWKTWAWRVAVLGTFLLFHAGMGLSMNLGNFQPLCILGWLALWPTESWDWLLARAPLRWLRRPRAAAGAASTPARLRPPVVQPLGATASCAATFLLAYFFLVNVNSWKEKHTEGEGALLGAALDARNEVRRHFHVQNLNLSGVLGMDQQWYLFGPLPAEIHGWLVLDGTLADGTHVDVLPFCWEGREAPVTRTRPERIADVYPNYRWRKYVTNLIKTPDDKLVYRQAFAAWAAAAWNRAHADEPSRQLTTLDVILMRETTQPNYQPLKRDRLRMVRLDCTAPDLLAPTAANLTEVVGPP